MIEFHASVIGKQNVIVKRQNKSHQELAATQHQSQKKLSDKINHMQSSFTSQMTELFEIVKDVGAKMGK